MHCMYSVNTDPLTTNCTIHCTYTHVKLILSMHHTYGVNTDPLTTNCAIHGMYT